jgi:1,4-alpha-glucan branching enzyme
MTSVTNGQVEFRFYRAHAEQVLLAGDFTNWSSRPIEMRPAGNGWWTAVAHLPAGEYRFKYVADGTWYPDYASHGLEPSPEGFNSVLVVPEVENQSNKTSNPKLAA